MPTHLETRQTHNGIITEILPENTPESVNLQHRGQLIRELHGRYARSARGRSQSGARAALKRLLWLSVVTGARFIKRMVDICVSAGGLVALSPIFAAVAIAIKATDRGPIFFWQTRVGQWGQEFPFPKFRSMVANAEKIREALAGKNDHATGVTFKMKKDPRITWIGRI